MKSTVRILAVASLLALSACATRPVHRLPPEQVGVAEQQQAQREAALRAQRTWSLSGRIALSNGRNGGSGRIEWQQDGSELHVSLSAPVTRQSWRLSVDGAGARLEGLEGGTRTGPDAAALLREATGWEIPVQSLGEWLRGLRAPAPVPASVQYDGEGRLSRLEQDGWVIDYRWPEAGAASPQLPARIDAVKGAAKVKLIVDDWQAPTHAAVLPDFGANMSSTSTLRRALELLDMVDPAADMRRNIALGDARPVGVCGFTCLAPGLEGETASGGLRVIEGTGDVVEGHEHLRLIQAASTYARDYNVALREWLGQHPDVAQSRPAGD